MSLVGYIKNGDKLEKIGVADNIPVGMILPWFLNDHIPVGFIRVRDTWYNSATYPALDAMYGDTYGREGGKFRLPPVWDNRFLEGSDVAGQYKEAGLPNIEGYSNNAITGQGATADDGSGAFRKTTTYSSAGRSWSTTNNGAFSTAIGFDFDASRYNRIYGNSDTVQPKAITVVWIIKAFEGASLSSTDIEITNLANEFIQFKADTNYVIDSGKSTDRTIWYRKWSDGWLEQIVKATVKGGNNTTTTVNIMPMQNTDYVVTFDGFSGQTYSSAQAININNYSISSFNVYGNSLVARETRFYVCGMGANE